MDEIVGIAVPLISTFLLKNWPYGFVWALTSSIHGIALKPDTLNLNCKSTQTCSPVWLKLTKVTMVITETERQLKPVEYLVEKERLHWHAKHQKNLERITLHSFALKSRVLKLDAQILRGVLGQILNLTRWCITGYLWYLKEMFKEKNLVINKSRDILQVKATSLIKKINAQGDVKTMSCIIRWHSTVQRSQWLSHASDSASKKKSTLWYTESCS